MNKVYYSEISSLIGPLTLFATDESLCYVQFGLFSEHEQEIRGWLKKQLGSYELEQVNLEQGQEHEQLMRQGQHLQEHEHGQLTRQGQHLHPILSEAEAQLEQYFSGERHTFDLPLTLYGTPFQKRVWEALIRIEYGRTKSYKEVAEAIDNPRAVRAVGMANNRNPLSIIIPCHRVIGHDGRLVGYGGGLTIKEKLLSLESGTFI